MQNKVLLEEKRVVRRLPPRVGRKRQNIQELRQGFCIFRSKRMQINSTLMAELKKYTSFEALKRDEQSTPAHRPKEDAFPEFEAFVRRLQTEYTRKKKRKMKNGRQSDR
jgi:hypothetical protein